MARTVSNRWGTVLLFGAVIVGTFAGTDAWGKQAMGQADSPSSLEVRQYRDAHHRSRVLRNLVFDTQTLVQQAQAGATSLPADLPDRIRRIHREYAELRDALFALTYAHASTLVETRPAKSFAVILGETTLTMAAAADLVMNADSAMTALAFTDPDTRLWESSGDAPGPTVAQTGRLVAADLHVQLQDLFRAGLPMLERHRPDLDQAYAQTLSAIHELMPEGIESGLMQMADAFRLLRAQVASHDLAEDKTALRSLVATATRDRRAWREELAGIQQRLMKDRGIVRGDIHVRLVQIKRRYLELREELYPLAFKYVGIISREDVAYSSDLRLHAIAISALAAGTLYENASPLQQMVAAVPGMKDLLNQADPAQGVPANLWDHIEREYASPEHRHLFKAGLKILEHHQADAQRVDPFLNYVATELSALTSLGEVRGESLTRRYARLLQHFESRTLATGVAGVEQGKIQTSKGFGNLVGAFEFRKGKLYNQRQWIDFVKTRIEPGDILLEKTPFRVTDKFIPGHFGHVALYVGTEARLKALGLWDHVAVIPYHKQIAEGRTIVEALRDGTQINSIAHFLNIDDLAILRPKPDAIPKDDVLQAIQLAFTHVGKKYDFGFDTNTWDTIVCSELAFQTYVNVRWPFGKTLGSYTISPDDVAFMAGIEPAQPFQLVSFVHDGEIASDLATAKRGEWYYRRLIEPQPTQEAGLLPKLPNPIQLIEPFLPGGKE